MDKDTCPDCGELLSIHRGVVPLTATLYCPHCNWCDVADGDRQQDAKTDFAERWDHNPPRSESYKPYVSPHDPNILVDCPYNDRGGPCWGQTTIVDAADTESQHVSYYACEGHEDVALYGYNDRYIPEK